MEYQTYEHDPVFDLDIYREWRTHPITAAGYPVKPPAEWFRPLELGLRGPTPLTILASGQVFGHIATWGQQHTGYARKVNPPRSRSKYAYFHTGQVVTADGSTVNVGQLTYAGGHAPVADEDGQPVSAAAAVAHYDNTGSAFCDVVASEDQYGIIVAGALRPTVTDVQLRTILASSPSGDWRPINGALEMIACCQVNVPGFPVVRALAASGTLIASANGTEGDSFDPDAELFALVAAGAPDMYALRMQQLASSEFSNATQRLTELEDKVAQLTASSEWMPQSTKWSEEAARESLFAYAEAQTDDPEKCKALLSSAFLSIAGEGLSKDDYRVPVAVARNGNIKFVWSGLVAAIGSLNDNTELSDEDREAALTAAFALQSEGRSVLGIEDPKAVSRSEASKLREQFAALSASASEPEARSKSSARTQFLRQQMAYLTAGGI
jgi:hypothetical protein